MKNKTKLSVASIDEIVAELRRRRDIGISPDFVLAYLSGETATKATMEISVAMAVGNVEQLGKTLVEMGADIRRRAAGIKSDLFPAVNIRHGSEWWNN